MLFVRSQHHVHSVVTLSDLSRSSKIFRDLAQHQILVLGDFRILLGELWMKDSHHLVSNLICPNEQEPERSVIRASGDLARYGPERSVILSGRGISRRGSCEIWLLRFLRDMAFARYGTWYLPGTLQIRSSSVSVHVGGFFRPSLRFICVTCLQGH